MSACPNERRNQALGDFKAALSRVYDGVVAVAARVEAGRVVDHEVATFELPEQVRNTMAEPPRRQERGRR